LCGAVFRPLFSFPNTGATGIIAENGGTPSMEAYIGLLLIGIFAFIILWAEGTFKSSGALFIAAAVILLAMVLRALCMDYETLDYQNFLTRWVRTIREQGGFQALKWNIGNYNVPYLYFLALFSYSRVRDLYLIKLLSVFFDVILAWGVMRLVYCFTDSAKKVLAAFLITLFLPTVFLNGAYWGQCDSIYVSFAVWSLYFALKDRPIASVCFIAISFAFKLQAVFLMPVFLIFLFARKMKWWHLAFFPLTYLLCVLPAIALGRPAKSTILLYFNQAGTVGSGLNYNSPSAYSFLRNAENPELLSKLGIAAAFLFLLILYAFCFVLRKRLNNRSLFVCALLIAVTVPFLLPHMHDRYFFMSDVLSLAFVFVFTGLLHVPVCVSFASLLGYHAYLKARYLLPMSYGAAALILVIITLIVTLAVVLTESGFSAGSSRKRLKNS